MTNDAPMFKSVGQALSIAFSVMDTEPTVKGTTESALRTMAEKRYGEAPVLQTERSVNKDGLKPNEFRAQCARIVATVDKELFGHERDAIYARFAKTTMKRAEAVRNLRDAFHSLCSTRSKEAVLALVWGLYVPGVIIFPGEDPREFNARRKKREKEWSTRSLEKEYAVGRAILRKDQVMLKELCQGIELQAQSKLEQIFLRAGLISNEGDGTE